MKIHSNMVGWFEIPTTDLNRAAEFYQKVFDIEIKLVEFGPLKMGWFPFDENLPGSPGSLVKNDENYTPSKKGVLVYFSSQAEDLTTELSRVEAAGGKIIQPKTLIKEDIGYMALFLDTEGNRIALHSRK
jgi:Predicted enzyme related to lactoylglutathione lyase